MATDNQRITAVEALANQTRSDVAALSAVHGEVNRRLQEMGESFKEQAAENLRCFEDVRNCIQAETEKIARIDVGMKVWKAKTAVVVAIVLALLAFVGPILGTYVSARIAPQPQSTEVVKQMIEEVKKLQQTTKAP